MRQLAEISARLNQPLSPAQVVGLSLYFAGKGEFTELSCSPDYYEELRRQAAAALGDQR